MNNLCTNASTKTYKVTVRKHQLHPEQIFTDYNLLGPNNLSWPITSQSPNTMVLHLSRPDLLTLLEHTHCSVEPVPVPSTTATIVTISSLRAEIKALSEKNGFQQNTIAYLQGKCELLEAELLRLRTLQKRHAL